MPKVLVCAVYIQIMENELLLTFSNFSVSSKDQFTGEVSVRATCFRSMRKSEKPHRLRVGEHKRQLNSK